MTFSQLTAGTRIHVLEITGTFKKNTTYSLGTVVSVSKPYDEPMPPTQFPMPMQNRRKLVDLVISCDGEQRKLSVSEDKTMMTDSNIGLTIATEKSQIINMVRQSLEDCRIKKESLSKIDEEMRRCEDILKILNVNSDITTNVTKDFKELDGECTLRLHGQEQIVADHYGSYHSDMYRFPRYPWIEPEYRFHWWT